MGWLDEPETPSGIDLLEVSDGRRSKAASAANENSPVRRTTMRARGPRHALRVAGWEPAGRAATFQCRDWDAHNAKSRQGRLKKTRTTPCLFSISRSLFLK